VKKKEAEVNTKSRRTMNSKKKRGALRKKERENNSIEGTQRPAPIDDQEKLQIIQNVEKETDNTNGNERKKTSSNSLKARSMTRQNTVRKKAQKETKVTFTDETKKATTIRITRSQECCYSCVGRN